MTDLAVKLDGVGKNYKFFSLEDVRLEIPYGHIMGFIGPNGAGKSTTIRILMGLLHQDRGDVHVLGHPMPSAQAAAKWNIGFASEDMRLYDSATLDWHMRFIRSIFPGWDQPTRSRCSNASISGQSRKSRASRTASGSRPCCSSSLRAARGSWCSTNRPPDSIRSHATKCCESSRTS